MDRDPGSDTVRLPSSAPAVLVEVGGQPGIARFAASFTIGRAPENDLVVTDASVSQRHAAVTLERDGWWLQDLGSTNGTVVAGRRIERMAVGSGLRVRLGHHGPSMRVTLEEAREEEAATRTAVPSETAIARRYLGRRAPSGMGELTAILRGALLKVQRRRSRRYLLVLAFFFLAAAAAAGYAYRLRGQVERQRAAASELFYRAKGLELDLARLQLDAEERESYRDRAGELDRRYRDLVEELGIYGPKTPREIQLVYRVVHRLGESEIDVPREFVDEVLRYIALWRTTPRLERAMARAREGNYGSRVAEIMLEQGLPPELFYLALQESDLDPGAVGPETRFGIAKGMWQMIPGTAREYGLLTGPLVGVRRRDPLDQRHDVERSTRAAARYLRQIYTTDAQASGLLVIAAYNWGQSNVLRLIRSLPENPRERNFWQLLIRHEDRIPRETYDYVFSIVSAAVIGEDPALFGFEFEAPFTRPTGPARTSAVEARGR
jgi:pSer/pThr/pTyr-binding forkhead associated (FHA) protein